MGLATEKWNIAFRQECGFADTETPYCRVKGSAEGWYADPFLWEIDGRVYLFAEFLSYKTRKGSIAYCVFDRQKQSFGKWKECITEPFHMSYPLLFEREGEIYMLPEIAESGTLTVYQAVSFPDRWEKAKTLRRNVSLVDSTPLPDGRLLLYSEKDGAGQGCFAEEEDGQGARQDLSALRPVEKSRPAGRCIHRNGDWILPTQDGSETYGGALIFYRTSETLSRFEPVFTLSPENLRVLGEKGSIRGVHTYNAGGGLEVVDYKTITVSPVRIADRLLQKAGLMR